MKKLRAFFYATASGHEPVRTWLLEMDEQDRKRIGLDIATAECGWPVGMPLCRKLGDGLWEIRSSLRDKRVARVLFAPVGDRMVLLHGFVKKTRKTPKPERELALNRLKEIL